MVETLIQITVMKQEQNNSILAIEVKVSDAGYSGVGVNAHDAEIIKERVNRFLSAEQAEKIKCMPAPNEDLRAASLEEVWHHILKSLQII
jgi:hypothetical protein